MSSERQADRREEGHPSSVSVCGSLETKRGFDADRRLWSQDAHVFADFILQQLGDLGVAEPPQLSG